MLTINPLLNQSGTRHENRFTRCVFVLVTCIFLSLFSGCSPLGERDEAALRKEYSEKYKSASLQQHLDSQRNGSVIIGLISQSVPGLHVAGVFADATMVLSNLDESIYGGGSIIARQRICPELIAKADYWNVLGIWFSNVKSSTEFESALSLAPLATPFVTRERAAEIFLLAVKKHGAVLVGAKLAGLITAKLTLKGIVGFVPLLGPIVAGGINWYIFHGVNEATKIYYEAKAEHVCKLKRLVPL